MVNASSAAEQLGAASAIWEISDDTTLASPILQTAEADEFRSSAAVVLARWVVARAAVRHARLWPRRTTAPPAPQAWSWLRSARPDRGGAWPCQFLGHAEADVRIHAAFALRSRGAEASPAVPALQQMLRADDAEAHDRRDARCHRPAIERPNRNWRGWRVKLPAM
jgi:hypothetical protein